MTPGKVASYFAIYIISSTIVVGGHNLFNALMPTLNPCILYQYPQSVWDFYCYWYRECPHWCNYFLIPRFATGSYAPESMPRPSTPLLYRNRHLHNTRPPNYSPMLDNTSSAVFALLLDYYYRRISNDLSLSATSANNFSKSMLSTLQTTNKPAYSGTDSKHIADTINTSKSGRRTGLSNTLNGVRGPQGYIPLSILPNTTLMGKYVNNASSETNQRVLEPHVLPQSIVNHDQTTMNTSTVPLVTDAHEVNIEKTSTNAITSYDEDSENKTGLPNNQTKSDFLFRTFRATLDRVERKFLLSVFTKLTAISPENRKENGISFLQSGFLLHQLLTALSMEADQNVTREIEECLGLNISENEKIVMLEKAALLLPTSSNVLKFGWSSRLVLPRTVGLGAGTQRAARAARLQLGWLNGNETAAQLAYQLNKMVELDSGGSMHDTFEEEEFSEGACAAAMGTGYVRATWRAAPTLLNDSLPFRDAPGAPQRTSRFFRLNDVMGYAFLHEWDAEAIEIPYATPGLTVLLVVPKEPALRPLVGRVSGRTLDGVLGVMAPVRLAVTLPLYTLRMTLLLHNKLEDMGIPSLQAANGTDCDSLKFSHGVQRLMFWAEAGRNAFKDDGIEWDPRPELEIVVDRPYLFFVRWQNLTIMNGAFVL